MKKIFCCALFYVGFACLFPITVSGQTKPSGVGSASHRLDRELGLSRLQTQKLILAMRYNSDQIDALMKNDQLKPEQRFKKLLVYHKQRDSILNSLLTLEQQERFRQIVRNELGQKRKQMEAALQVRKQSEHRGVIYEMQPSKTP